jgi:hypothetical protein
MTKFPRFIQVKADEKTIRQLRRIAKHYKRSMSDVVRLMIEREDAALKHQPTSSGSASDSLPPLL